MSTWLITGCSTGLGRALANAVLARGDNAVVTARNAATVQDLADRYPASALALALDVTDSAQIAQVLTQAENRFGAVDILVNNAGYGYRAAVEEGDDGDVRKLFDTNVFGPVAMIKAVLPGMRSRRAGAIVNTPRSVPGSPRRVRAITRPRSRRSKGCPDRCGKSLLRWGSR